MAIIPDTLNGLDARIGRTTERQNQVTNSDILFTGPIPQLYELLMVPMLFDVYAQDLVNRIADHVTADLLETANVLEIAAGTGIVTRALAAMLGPKARITATDLNQPMLDLAASRLGPDPRVSFQQADAQALPFPGQSFDLVLCQFGVMFFPDKLKAYAEARRVLKPGGAMLFNVWDQLSENAFVTVVSAALADLFPDNPPAFLARIPHGYHDITLIAQQLADAGFISCTPEAVGAISHATTPLDAAKAYCQGTPLRAEIEARGGGLEAATTSAADALARHFGPGPIQGGIRAYVIAATT